MPHQANTKKTTKNRHLSERPDPLQMAVNLRSRTNLDYIVNGADLNIVLSNYNQSGMDWSQGDFDGDGTVNGSDLNVVLSNYNQSIGVGAAVPEPGTFVVLGIGVSALAAFRRRRVRIVLFHRCRHKTS
jgi:hypothetical protein